MDYLLANSPTVKVHAFDFIVKPLGKITLDS